LVRKVIAVILYALTTTRMCVRCISSSEILFGDMRKFGKGWSGNVVRDPGTWSMGSCWVLDRAASTLTNDGSDELV
jgi:hypothetical protein